MNKITKVARTIVEYIWLGVAAISLFIAAREAFRHDVRQVLIFALFSLIAVFFFIYHHGQRKNSQS